MVGLIEQSVERGHNAVDASLSQPAIEVPVVADASGRSSELSVASNEDKPDISDISVEPYRFASFDGIRSSDAFYEASIQRIGEDCMRVLEVEAPIHRDELVRRVADFWGFQRAGNKIGERILRSIDYLDRRELVEVRGDFVYLPNSGPPQVRSRALDGVIFQAEHIAPEEIKAAVRLLLRHRAPLLPSEILSETARLLGFGRTGKHLRTVIDDAIKRLKEAGELEVGGLGNRLAKEVVREKPAEETPRTRKPEPSISGTPRPFFRHAIEQLETVVQEHSEDRGVLGLVLQELERRSTAKARQLRGHVKRLLA
jgi:hypothetical protein